MDKNALSAVVARIDGYRDDVIRLQTELCKRPALDPTSGGIGEIEKAAFLKAYLESLGLKVAQYDSPDPRVPSGRRPNLAVSGADQRTAVVDHLTPPMSSAGDLRCGPATRGFRTRGRAHRRGVEDNQGADRGGRWR
jgi:succinyl-diaminopimelate desuccinylase